MNRFKNVLCVVDSEHVGEPALGRAVALSAHNQASLTVVDVVEQVTVDIGILNGGVGTADLQAAIVKAQARDLDTVVEPYRSEIDITTRILVGVPFLAIIREVLCHEHDLLIKIADTPEWLDRVLRSVTCTSCASAPAPSGSSPLRRRPPVDASSPPLMLTTYFRRPN